jgi:hypothetical protein
MTDDIVILHLCSERAKFGVRVNIDQLSENRYSKERFAEIKSTLQDLLQLLRSSSNFVQHHYDDGKDDVLGHNLESLYRCKECDQVFTTSIDVLKHEKETGHKGTIMSSRFCSLAFSSPDYVQSVSVDVLSCTMCVYLCWFLEPQPCCTTFYCSA